MKDSKKHILIINGGSSSIKFALYQKFENSLKRGLYGQIDHIGQSNIQLTFNDSNKKSLITRNLPISDKEMIVPYLMDWLETQCDFNAIQAVGHRLVHGMEHSEPQRIFPALLEELKHIRLFSPEHLPLEIAFVESVCKRYPEIPQIACFDTAFHRTMPRVASLLPIPRRYDTKGIKRYGFDGLSYSYLVEELGRLGDSAVTEGNLVLAHLGNGVSLAAVQRGRCIDTSMGFTPSAGLPMGTRTGDLDPGVVWYMMHNENLTLQQLNKLINQESGLLGISETSADMQTLLELQATDERAAEAVALFCYQLKKWIGSFTAALGGLDTLVFTGGIGENAPEIRGRVCSGLEFLGIGIEEKLNSCNASIISSASSRVAVRVIHTDEELMIAQSVCRVLVL